MSHSILHPNDSLKANDSLRNETDEYLYEWVSHSILYSNNLFKSTDSFGNETTALFVANSVLASFGSVFIDGAEMDKVTGNIVYEM